MFLARYFSDSSRILAGVALVTACTHCGCSRSSSSALVPADFGYEVVYINDHKFIRNTKKIIVIPSKAIMPNYDVIEDYCITPRGLCIASIYKNTGGSFSGYCVYDMVAHKYVISLGSVDEVKKLLLTGSADHDDEIAKCARAIGLQLRDD